MSHEKKQLLPCRLKVIYPGMDDSFIIGRTSVFYKSWDKELQYLLGPGIPSGITSLVSFLLSGICNN